MLISHKIQRNKKCSCGSGKKTKHCCLEKMLRVRRKLEEGVPREQIANEEIFLHSAKSTGV